ncbi:hypothetical protein FOZ62_032204 [Perkinsus olseni]|uniref:Uncharacterized protein n=1 Tax=Perkinsus olseni TaxID=32597 RepID=A0A7J6RV37_PEROL|nr:hypothetical protein FOZ62_032204 [Perkinsus olseni]
MMNLFSTRWLVALVSVVIITEAQHFGTFVHETAFYTMTYDVEENYEVTFGFNVTVQPSELYPDAESSSFKIGPFSLKRVHQDAFTVDFEGQEDTRRDWYLSMEKALIAGRLVSQPSSQYPPLDMSLGDLTTITYKDADTLLTTFQKGRMNFRRTTHSPRPGRFLYQDCMNPSLQLSVEIESESHVGIAATCGWRYTPYVRFNLERRSRTLYDHYDVVPAGEVTLEKFRQMVRSACPTRYVTDFDLFFIIVATERVILVEFEGVILPLVQSTTSPS